jgi:hypothetical protein
MALRPDIHATSDFASFKFRLNRLKNYFAEPEQFLKFTFLKIPFRGLLQRRSFHLHYKENIAIR